jgi:hypothetical protein
VLTPLLRRHNIYHLATWTTGEVMQRSNLATEFFVKSSGLVTQDFSSHGALAKLPPGLT